MTYDEEREPEDYNGGSIGQQLDPEDIALGDFAQDDDDNDNNDNN